MTIPSLDIRLQDRKSFVLCVQTKWNISKLLGLGFHQILIQELSAPVWLCACILISFFTHNAPRKDRKNPTSFDAMCCFSFYVFFNNNNLIVLKVLKLGQKNVSTMTTIVICGSSTHTSMYVCSPPLSEMFHFDWQGVICFRALYM